MLDCSCLEALLRNWHSKSLWSVFRNSNVEESKENLVFLSVTVWELGLVVGTHGNRHGTQQRETLRCGAGGNFVGAQRVKRRTPGAKRCTTPSWTSEVRPVKKKAGLSKHFAAARCVQPTTPDPKLQLGLWKEVHILERSPAPPVLKAQSREEGRGCGGVVNTNQHIATTRNCMQQLAVAMQLHSPLLLQSNFSLLHFSFFATCNKKTPRVSSICFCRRLWGAVQ